MIPSCGGTSIKVGAVLEAGVTAVSVPVLSKEDLEYVSRVVTQERAKTLAEIMGRMEQPEQKETFKAFCGVIGVEVPPEKTEIAPVEPTLRDKSNPRWKGRWASFFGLVR